MKKGLLLGAVLVSAVVIMAGCGKKEQAPEEPTTQQAAAGEAKEGFLGDAIMEEDGTVKQIGEAEEGWEAARDKALKDAQSDGSKAPGESFDRAMAEEIIKLVNKERESRGLNKLTMDETMMSAAQVRAQEQKTQFSHTRPDGSDAFTVFAQFEIPANYRGENLACGGISSAETVMNLWMNSEGHCANILNGRFSRIGVGVFTSGRYGYWCQLFAN